MCIRDRFDDVVEYHLPSPAQAADLIRSRLGFFAPKPFRKDTLQAVSYTHLRAHETVLDLVCRLLLEKNNNTNKNIRCTNHPKYIKTKRLENIDTI